VPVGHAAADHGEQLVVWPVDIAGEKGAGGVGFVEHAGAGAVVEETGGAGGGGHTDTAAVGVVAVGGDDGGTLADFSLLGSIFVRI